MISPSRSIHRRHTFALLLVGLWNFTCLAVKSAPVINEIMYRVDALTLPENTQLEFVELHNPDPLVSQNLSGWKFISGIRFTFPADTVIPPGGYLIVAADKDALLAEHPDLEPERIVGNWAGKLSNSGETIELVNASDETVSQVRYRDRGTEWAKRIRGEDDLGFQGWRWLAEQDGSGKSLELVNAALPIDFGYNWSPSLESGGTPGRQNSVVNDDAAPLIRKVTHVPAIPRASEAVTVTARVVDETVPTMAVNLRWRLDGQPVFESTAMSDSGEHSDGAAGDGVYGAAIAPQSDDTIVEYYVEAVDETGQIRTWPAPTASGSQETNALYQVDSSFDPASLSDRHPLYRMILTESERQELADISANQPLTNAQLNATFISADVSGIRIRHNCGVRMRGNGSRFDEVKSYKIQFTRSWKGYSQINLNGKATWTQVLGSVLIQQMGGLAPDEQRIELLVNGQDLSGGRANDETYGSYAQVEPRNSDLTENHFPADPDGNLYRIEDDLVYKGPDPADYMDFRKQTNASEADWSDLEQLTRALSVAGDEEYAEAIHAIVDVENWLRYLAINMILANGESSLAKGADEDFLFYRGKEDARFKAIFWDLDSVLEDTEGIGIFGVEIEPLIERFIQHPPFLQRYYQIVLEILETGFSKGEFEKTVDEICRGWLPLDHIAELKSFGELRRTDVRNLIPSEVQYERPAVAAATFTRTPVGPVQINEILASNQSAKPVGDTFPDAIELYNDSNEPVDLGGMRLTDQPDVPFKYIFPQGTVIPAEGYLTVYADNGTHPGGIFTQFGLSARGESLSLFDASDNLLDQVVFGPQITDLSIGRLPASDTWTLTVPTLGAPNEASPLGDGSEVVVNEWMARSGFRTGDDFVELFNRDSLPVDMSGFGLTDEPADAHRHQLPPLSFIDGLGFLAFEADGNPERGPDHLSFSISSQREWIGLFDSDRNRIDLQLGTYLATDISQGRNPDGTATISRLAIPTPGAPNVITESIQQQLDHLRITRIHYHPIENSPFEFLEIQNIGSDPVNLGGIRLAGDIQFTFPDLTLLGGGKALVVENLLAFGDSIIPVAGQFQGRLSNSGREISLLLPDSDTAILRFEYLDTWYPETDGLGSGLEAVNPFAAPQAWNLREQWQPVPVGPYSGTLTYASWAAVNGIVDPFSDDDHDEMTAFYEYALGLSPTAPPPADEPDAVLGFLSEDAADSLAIFDLPDPVRPDVWYRVQYTNDLPADEWTTILEKRGLAPWSGSAGLEETMIGTNRRQLNVLLPNPEEARGFVRLCVELIVD
ncbi:MAG: lamin tail domain-containing protein [Verrucomicrobiota bacterium]